MFWVKVKIPFRHRGDDTYVLTYGIDLPSCRILANFV